MPGEISDKALLERVAARDQNAMKALYERHSGPLYQFVTYRLRDTFDAHDIMHETMLTVWRQAERFEGRSSVKSWIFSIARNKSIDRNRRGPNTHYADADPEIPDESPDPYQVREATEDADRVRAAVNKLSEMHRAVIHLAFFEDLSYAEIAEIEGCPVGTVKTRIMHAKKLMMHHLAASEDEKSG